MSHAGPANRYHGAHSSAVKRSNPVRYRSCTLGVCACVCDIHHFGCMAAHHVHTLNVLQRIMAHGPLIATAGCQSHCGCLSERTVAAAVRVAASKNAVGAHPQLLLFVMAWCGTCTAQCTMVYPSAACLEKTWHMPTLCRHQCSLVLSSVVCMAGQHKCSMWNVCAGAAEVCDLCLSCTSPQHLLC